MIPTASRTIVHLDDRTFSWLPRSPLMTRPPTYDEYVVAWTVLVPLGTDQATPTAYVTGFVAGYRLLTGAEPDVFVALAISRLFQARPDRSYGSGAMDAWRLVVENPMDVAAVVGRIGQ